MDLELVIGRPVPRPLKRHGDNIVRFLFPVRCLMPSGRVTVNIEISGERRCARASNSLARRSHGRLDCVDRAGEPTGESLISDVVVGDHMRTTPPATDDELCSLTGASLSRARRREARYRGN
jgi:hypothetical protein